jgi:hypothetical protein
VRAYHSASSVALGKRCPRAWAYAYIDGLRLPGSPATALGSRVHAVFERFFRGESVDWLSEEGRIAASGIEYLPRPEACSAIEVERPIGSLPTPMADGSSGVSFEAHGVRWAGFRDLAVRVDGLWYQVDYKTTASIAKWAKTPAELRADAQCCLYSLELAARKGLDVVSSRWLYLEAKQVRRAFPVDVRMTADEALEALSPAAALAKALDQIPDTASAEQRTSACDDFGGCGYHQRQGGPCDARRSVSSYFAQRKGMNMALDPATAKKFGALASPPPAPPPPAPKKPGAFGASPVAVVAGPDAPKRRGRPPKSESAGPTPAAAPLPASPSAGPAGSAADLAALVERIAAAETAIAEDQAELSAARAALREACA